MNKKKSYFFDFGVVIGVLGTISGIFLLTQGNWLIGVFGTISSAFIAYISYNNRKAKKEG